MRHVLPALLQSMAACWTSNRSIIRGFAGYRRRIRTAASPPVSWHEKKKNHNVILGGTWTRRTTTTTTSCCCFVPLLVDAPIHAHPRQHQPQGQRRPRLSNTVWAVHRNPTRPTRVRFFSSSVDKDDDPTAAAPAKDDGWTQDLRACWQATSFTANPHSDPAMDGILQGLVSPAPQSLFVLERAIQKATTPSSTPTSTSTRHSSVGGQDETTRRRILLGPALAPFTYLLKQGYHFSKPSALAATQHNNSSGIVAGVDWTIRPIAPQDDTNVDTDKNNNNNELWEPLFDSTSNQQQQHWGCRALAEHLLDYIQTESHAQRPIDESVVTAHVDQIEGRLQQTLGTDVRGRTAADTLFCLAVAGVTRHRLYNQLLEICGLELQRTGPRVSHRVRDIRHVVEKVAASGLVGPHVQAFYHVAGTCKPPPPTSHDNNKRPTKDQIRDETVLQQIRDEARLLHALSPRPLMWMWKFSKRQPKAKEQRQQQGRRQGPSSSSSSSSSLDRSSSSQAHEGGPPVRVLYETKWLDHFQANTTTATKPLVVDLGCGFGASLLGLASLENSVTPTNVVLPSHLPSTSSPADAAALAWSECHFVGCDLSQLAIRYGRGMAHRWGLEDRLQFCHASVQHVLEQVEHEYSGPVAGILIQFPSPYRLPVGGEESSFLSSGNSQLPTDTKSGFMITNDLMMQIVRILTKSQGHLLIQSNCEDVAIHLQKLAKDCGMQNIVLDPPNSSSTAKTTAKQDKDVQTPSNHHDNNNNGMEERLTERTRRWLELLGDDATTMDRARGPEWSSVPLLPPGCRTETEVSCEFNGTPVHRCILRPAPKQRRRP